MANMKEIKKRIKSVSDTKKITNAMYLTSSAKFASCRETLSRTASWFDAINKEAGLIAAFSKDNKFVKKRNGKVLYLLIAAEKGLAGDFSKEVVKKYQTIEKDENDELIIIGDAAKKLCITAKISFNQSFEYSIKKPNYETAKDISDYLINRYETEEIAKIVVISNEFVKNSNQVKVKQYLPIVLMESEKSDFRFYPDKESICNEVISSYLNAFIYSSLLSSYCGEQNARMMAMDNANKNAGKLLDELTVQYNHQRQNTITGEITEIASGRNRNREDN